MCHEPFYRLTMGKPPGEDIKIKKRECKRATHDAARRAYRFAERELSLYFLRLVFPAFRAASQRLFAAAAILALASADRCRRGFRPRGFAAL